MKLTLEALEAIDAIARCGTYAAAAEELNKVPSALSYTVQKLETELAIKIFDRTGHRARLTDTGRLLLQRGRDLLRDARELECRARRSDQGWETELRIALDMIVPFGAILPYIQAFYGESSTTRLCFSQEVLGGSWDALHSHRADLVIGAMGNPPFAGVSMHPIGTVEMVFCVAPAHPLAHAAEPLNPRSVARYRGVVIGDTSRALRPRSIGIFEGQEAVTVPSIEAKLALQLAGLGSGYLPRWVAQPYLEAGQLLRKDLATPPISQTFHLAWHDDHLGRAMQWWTTALARPNLLDDMWRP